MHARRKVKVKRDTEEPPRKKKKGVTYRDPKTKVKEIKLPGEELWTFAALQRQRQAFVNEGTMPTLTTLPKIYTNIETPRATREEGIVHDLKDDRVHPGYIIAGKQHLRKEIEEELQKNMGDRNYAKEPFPKRLFNS